MLAGQRDTAARDESQPLVKGDRPRVLGSGGVVDNLTFEPLQPCFGQPAAYSPAPILSRDGDTTEVTATRSGASGGTIAGCHESRLTESHDGPIGLRNDEEACRVSEDFGKARVPLIDRPTGVAGDDRRRSREVVCRRVTNTHVIPHE